MAIAVQQSDPVAHLPLVLGVLRHLEIATVIDRLIPPCTNRAMTLFTSVCTYADRVRSAEVLQYQCMVYRASKPHSAASPHDCFSKCWIARKVGKS